MNLKDAVYLLLVIGVGVFAMRETNALKVELAELRMMLSQTAGVHGVGGPNAEALPPLSAEDEARIAKLDALSARSIPRDESLSPVAAEQPSTTSRLAASVPPVYLDKAVLSVAARNLGQSLARVRVQELPDGLKLLGVEQGSLMMLLEFQTDDVLQAFDGKPIQSIADVGAFFKILERNGRARVKLVRHGQEVELEYRMLAPQ